MSEVRTRDTETLLANGKVLAAGGWNGGVTAGAEIYDPSTGSWSSAGHMTTPRTNHVAVLLPSGKVLVAGGEPVNGGTSRTAAAELYGPTTSTWSATGSMNVGRSLFTAVLLPNGKVLAVGGCTDSGATATAELYDPGTGMWTLTGSMQYARCLSQGQHAVALPSGNELVAGGESSATSQEYDPATGTWAVPVSMGKPRCGGGTAALHDGRVLVVGGDDCVSRNNLVLLAQAYKPSHQPCRREMRRCT
jgi:N-acetylneuraminic acid mutarotase